MPRVLISDKLEATGLDLLRHAGVELDPPLLAVNRSYAPRIEAFVAPQIQDLIFMWYDVYVITVSWWFTVLYYPNIRRVSIRPMFWPHIWAPSGLPSGYSIGWDQSQRIKRTRAYASAM